MFLSLEKLPDKTADFTPKLRAMAEMSNGKFSRFAEKSGRKRIGQHFFDKWDG